MLIEIADLFDDAARKLRTLAAVTPHVTTLSWKCLWGPRLPDSPLEPMGRLVDGE